MVYRIPNHITWKNLDEGVVLLDLNSSKYYTLNETASLVWRGIMESKTEEAIVDLLLEEYQCDKEQCRLDVHEQMELLSGEGLIVS